jgi:hypothetical protein
MNDEKKIDLVRHKTRCSICSHPDVQEINQAFINWTSPTEIIREFQLGDKSKLFRHARACQLYEKRERNLRFALGKLIERASEVQLTASAVVQAYATLAKLNANGMWVERTEAVNLNKLFDKMTTSELEAYAREGIMPAWSDVTITVDALPSVKSDE